jgi:uncharacterized protein (TIGR03435 family)
MPCPTCCDNPCRAKVIPTLLLSLVLLGAIANAGAQEQAASKPSTPAPTQSTTFDVISIRPSDPKNLSMTIRPTPNNFIVTGASLKFIVQYAYDLHGFQLEGVPAWMASTRFDIVAKSETASAPAQSEDFEASQKLTRTRLQSLLADRFQFRAHKGTMQMPVYGLVVAKGGPKLEASTASTGFSTRPGQFICSDATMDDLASLLSGSMDRMVIDQTKLPGSYKFTLKWTPDESPNPNPNLPGIFTAIQEQLGLKLVPTKGPVEMLIIDHIEQPSAN